MEVPNTNPDKPSLILPTEMLVHVFSILSFTKDSQSTLHSCTLVSRLWYAAAVEALYKYPHITGKNFQLFVNTICPSINVHVKKSEFSNMVRRLDMSKLVHDSSKSLTARILGRCKERLEEFIAPQASFAVNCLAALSKCKNLRSLDLSWISEALDLSAFFNAIRKLEKLECLYYPRSSQAGRGATQHLALWPANLRELHISGNISHESLSFFSNFPPYLNKLTFADDNALGQISIVRILEKLGPQLHSLALGSPMKSLGYIDVFDVLLPHLPVLRRLSISIEYLVFGTFIDEEPDPESAYMSSLVELQLNADRITNGPYLPRIFRILCEAVVDGRLGRLRKVMVQRQLIHEKTRAYVHELDILLGALGREDGLALDSDHKIDAGVWLFGE